MRYHLWFCLKGPSQPHLCFCLEYRREFGYYILFGACRNERKSTVKLLNNFDVIENGGG